MARRLALLPLLLVPLALPAAADARSKSVTLRLPADGGISFARYVVTTAKPDDVTIRNARRLGSSMVLTAARPLSRRRYELTAMLVNPDGGAGAAQGDRFYEMSVRSRGQAKIAVAKTGGADDVLTQPVTTAEASAVNRLCERPPPTRLRRIVRRSRGFFSARGGAAGTRRRIRVLFTPEVCQDKPAATIAPASRQLRELGVAVPGCVGSVQRYQGSPNEVSARMVCTQATNLFSLRATPGNDGLNCLGPPGSTCACGPFCAPLPPESACYGDSNGFDMDTLLEFRASFEQAVKPEDVTGIWVPQGSPSLDGQYAYLRLILDTP
jgi:hypothetical protein